MLSQRIVALDYIWLAKKPASVDCALLPSIAGLLPNADEPSDHLMLAAEITFAQFEG